MALKTFTFRPHLEIEEEWEQVIAWCNHHHISMGHLISRVCVPLAYALENETYYDPKTRELGIVLDAGYICIRPPQ